MIKTGERLYFITRNNTTSYITVSKCDGEFVYGMTKTGKYVKGELSLVGKTIFLSLDDLRKCFSNEIIDGNKKSGGKIDTRAAAKDSMPRYRYNRMDGSPYASPTPTMRYRKKYNK